MLRWQQNMFETFDFSFTQTFWAPESASWDPRLAATWYLSILLGLLPAERIRPNVSCHLFSFQTMRATKLEHQHTACGYCNSCLLNSHLCKELSRLHPKQTDPEASWEHREGWQIMSQMSANFSWSSNMSTLTIGGSNIFQHVPTWEHQAFPTSIHHCPGLEPRLWEGCLTPGDHSNRNLLGWDWANLGQHDLRSLNAYGIPEHIQGHLPAALGHDDGPAPHSSHLQLHPTSLSLPCGICRCLLFLHAEGLCCDPPSSCHEIVGDKTWQIWWWAGDVVGWKPNPNCSKSTLINRLGHTWFTFYHFMAPEWSAQRHRGRRSCSPELATP